MQEKIESLVRDAENSDSCFIWHFFVINYILEDKEIRSENKDKEGGSDYEEVVTFIYIVPLIVTITCLSTEKIT